jgi:methylmalonyl-CoA mutase N-terminal domain/subunit
MAVARQRDALFTTMTMRQFAGFGTADERGSRGRQLKRYGNARSWHTEGRGVYLHDNQRASGRDTCGLRGGRRPVNLMDSLLGRARAQCTEGEIVKSLQRVFGTYTETPVF